jgi:hypothetical protein
MGYYRSSYYGGTPWTSTGGYQVQFAPTMGGEPYTRERYIHL